MAPVKASAQTRHLADRMATFEEKVLNEFESLHAIHAQMEGITSIQARLDELDTKFGEKAARLAQVQAKVNLSVSSIGQIHQEQVHVARVLKASSTTVDAET